MPEALNLSPAQEKLGLEETPYNSHLKTAQKFKVTLGYYTMSSKSVWALWDHISEKKKEQK